jgi:low temperature requirement protein LtrA
MPPANPLRAAQEQSVAFVELFFDLVFVFAVTQVTVMTAHSFDAVGIWRAVLVFWLIWWAWTQFTWTLNPADTGHHAVRLITLLATAAAFVMATSVQRAFGEEALWFALPYLVVRILGLGLQVAIAAEHSGSGEAAGGRWGVPGNVRRWAGLSCLGLVAVLVGALVPVPARGWVWVGAIVLDLIAAAMAGSSDEPWDLGVGHLAERHGLFVIIAIGESLIVAAAAAAGNERTIDLILVAGGGITVAGLMWWAYFGWFMEGLQAGFAAVTPVERGPAARDAYSLAHFPLVCGIVGFAVAAESMVRHPADPVTDTALVALGAGIALFMGATILAYFRLHGVVLRPRLLITAVTTVALIPARGLPPAVALTIVAVGSAGVVFAERGRAHPGRYVERSSISQA